MSPQELDVIVRVAGATLLAWAALRRRSAGRLYFIALAVCLCGFLAGNTPDPSLRLSGPLGSLGVIVAGYAAVFMWLYCLAVFEDGFRPRGWVPAVGIAWVVTASADRGLFGEALADRGLSWVLIGLGLAMIGHLGWRLLKDRPGDLIDRRREARVAVVVALAAQLLADFCVDIFLGMDWQPHAFSIAQNGALLLFTGWLLSLDLTRSPAEPAQPKAPPPAASPLTSRLEALMEQERIYLDPDLTFDAFVRAMAAPERTVRRLINRDLGYDHFRTFLNAYRVREAKRLLGDPARAGDKLTAIAFDSGFASLPSFNRVFRDVEGQTPSAFREAALAMAQASEKRPAAF